MKVDLSLSNARIYDVTRFDVVIGEKFSMKTDGIGDEHLYSDNDPVLAIKVNGTNIDASADQLGTSSILIMDKNRSILKELIISVVDAILPLATSLGLSADSPSQK